MPEDNTWVFVLISVTIPISILLVTCVFAFKMRKALTRARKRAKEAQRRRLLDAIDTTRSLQFPAVLVPLADFVAMGRLEPFEKLRDSGVRLRYFDALEQLEVSDGCKIVFLSHQYASLRPRPPNHGRASVTRPPTRSGPMSGQVDVVHRAGSKR